MWTVGKLKAHCALAGIHPQRIDAIEGGLVATIGWLSLGVMLDGRCCLAMDPPGTPRGDDADMEFPSVEKALAAVRDIITKDLVVAVSILNTGLSALCLSPVESENVGRALSVLQQRVTTP